MITKRQIIRELKRYFGHDKCKNKNLKNVFCEIKHQKKMIKVIKNKPIYMSKYKKGYLVNYYDQNKKIIYDNNHKKYQLFYYFGCYIVFYIEQPQKKTN